MKKNKLNFILIFIIILLVLFYFVNSRKKTETQSQQTTPQNQANYNDVVPGVSNREELFVNLGDPLNDKQEDTLEFPSSAAGKPHFIEIERDVVKIIRETVTLDDDVSIKDITQKYGNTKNILFDARSLGGFYLFVYPEKGIAYIGHPESGLLLEIWYFPATDFENFKQEYAVGYSTDIPNQY